MPPAKTNNGCKRLKRSRKDNSIISSHEDRNADINGEMVVEYPSNQHASFNQQSSQTITPSTPYPTNDHSSPVENNPTTQKSTPQVIASSLLSSITSNVRLSSSTIRAASKTKITSSTDKHSSSSSTHILSTSHVTPNKLPSSQSVSNDTSATANRSISLTEKNSSPSPSSAFRTTPHQLSSSQPVSNDSSSSINLSTSNKSSASLKNLLSTTIATSDQLPSSQPVSNKSSSLVKCLILTSNNCSLSSSVNRSTSNKHSSSSSTTTNLLSSSRATPDQFPPSQSILNGSSAVANRPVSTSNNRSSLSRNNSLDDDVVDSITNDNGHNHLKNNASRKDSLVWQYAERNRKDQTALCKLCPTPRIIKTTNWSTTGLRKHLAQVHKMTELEPVVAPKQSTISPALRKELHDLIVKAIIEDGRSFNDFRRPGLMKVLRKIIPGYVPPHRITVSRRLKYFDKTYKQRLQQEMLQVSKVSITCDFWSDRSSKSHLCVTGHDVTNEFGYVSTILSFEAFYDRHHGIRIANIIRQKLYDLNLENKLLCITTDGASNMRTMCENLIDINSNWIWCVAHRYHLVIINALGFWPKKKKKKKSKEDNNNDNNNNKQDNNDNHNINNNPNTANNNMENDYNENFEFDHDHNKNNDNDDDNHNHDATQIDSFNDGGDDQSFWDDATKDRPIGLQHLFNFDEVQDNESIGLNNYDEELLNIEEIILGAISQQLNGQQLPNNEQISNAQQVLNGEQVTYVPVDASFDTNDIQNTIDDETFVDYMMNNNLIRDNWDVNLDLSDNDIYNESNRKTIFEVIHKCRSLICLIKQSTVLNGYFDQLRREFKTKRGLPIDCATRWNSTYFLVDSFIKAKALIIKFFGEKNTYNARRDLMQRLIQIELHHDDWTLINDIHTVLKPFYLATRIMSSRSYPTAGLCYYTVKSILNYLTTDDTKDNLQRKTLKLLLLSKYQCYFLSDENQLNLLKKYAYFDPLGFSSLDEAAIRNIEHEIKQIVQNENISVDDSLTTSSSNSFSSTTLAAQIGSSKYNQILSTIDEFMLACDESPINNLQTNASRRLTIDEELVIYKEVISGFYREYKTRAFALDFWKKHNMNFPILSHLARAYLSTPGTSIASESAFSISAYVARKERSKLSPENLSYTCL